MKIAYSLTLRQHKVREKPDVYISRRSNGFKEILASEPCNRVAGTGFA